MSPEEQRQRWEGVLEEMERRLVLHREALYGNGEAPSCVEIPSDIGQMPADLQRRAESVLALTESIRQEAAEKRQVVSAAMTAVQVRQSHAETNPVYLDTRA